MLRIHRTIRVSNLPACAMILDLDMATGDADDTSITVHLLHKCIVPT